MKVRSGRVEAIPYSLSRWTDLPAAKWSWFTDAMASGRMMAFDPRDPVPTLWSLRPEDTLALLFWTKDPSHLLRDRSLLTAYDVRVHMTLTGWVEAEKGAPNLAEGSLLLQRTVREFGTGKVTWRFSPVPALPEEEVVRRFGQIATAASVVGVNETYLSFLQPNDRVPESRTPGGRGHLLTRLADVARPLGITVRLCADDTIVPRTESGPERSVCVPPEGFAGNTPFEGCGCAVMADPFTINESCTFGCTYCYAADTGTSTHKRNTTRHLPLLR